VHEALGRGEPAVRDRLVTTLFLAGLLHAMVILGVTFSAGQGADDAAPGIDVQLVADDAADEARSSPASYLAQLTRQGSGTTRERVVARTPLGVPPEPAGAPLQGRPGSEQLAQPSGASQADPVLGTTARRVTVRYSGPPAPEVSAETSREAAQLAGRQAPTLDSGGEDPVERVQLTGPEAQAGGWVSPDTQSSVVAPYMDGWRRKVERLGTLNYPVSARAGGATRSPVLEVELAADGRLRSVSIRRTSGLPSLDEAALQILRLASPFEPFPSDMAAAYPVLRFAYEWQFEQGNSVRLRGTR
jgi:protein TonB